jgi:hypothetical protein
MITYEQIGNWLKEKENKDKLVLAVSFVLVFLVGFGAGGYVKEIRRDSYKPKINYTTQQAKKPAAPQVAGIATAQPTSSSTTASLANCVIKGNISAAGSKIYHVSGGAFYKTVKPEQCFNTEAEAQAAGFRKSGR